MKKIKEFELKKYLVKNGRVGYDRKDGLDISAEPGEVIELAIAPDDPCILSGNLVPVKD